MEDEDNPVFMEDFIEWINTLSLDPASLHWYKKLWNRLMPIKRFKFEPRYWHTYFTRHTDG